MISSDEFFAGRPAGIDSDASSVESALRIIAKRFPSIGTVPDLKRRCKHKTDGGKVTLSWFYEEFPSFPVRVVYKNIPWVRDMWAGLHSGFKHSELYSAWEEEASLAKRAGYDHEGKPMAIVFNWPKWKMCCMHNAVSEEFGGSWYNVATANDKECIKIYKSLGNGQSFVIEPFEQLLDSITWSN